jgi:hypothetical protein
MKNLMPLLVVFAAATCVAGCKTKEQKSRIAVEEFKQATAGSWKSESGADLHIAPVRARMVTDEAIYVERIGSDGSVFYRLVNLELAKDGDRIIQRALMFTQDGQWRNLREQPEMFTALLPKDVRPAGTCDIKPSADANSLTYSCAGSVPETFTRAE